MRCMTSPCSIPGSMPYTPLIATRPNTNLSQTQLSGFFNDSSVLCLLGALLLPLELWNYIFSSSVRFPDSLLLLLRSRLSRISLKVQLQQRGDIGIWPCLSDRSAT